MTMVIGVDPYKRTHTAVVIDHDEIPLASLQVRAGRLQVEELLAWSASFDDRVWAIEPAKGSAISLPAARWPASECWTCPRRCRLGCGCWRRHARTRTTRTTRCQSRSRAATRRASTKCKPRIIRWYCGSW